MTVTGPNVKTAATYAGGKMNIAMRVAGIATIINRAKTTAVPPGLGSVLITGGFGFIYSP